MTIFGGIAEFERSLILSRTQEGREAAMARGAAFGRPSKLRDDQKEVVRDLVKKRAVHFHRSRNIQPKFSSWGKEVLCQVVDVDPITVLGNFKNG